MSNQEQQVVAETQKVTGDQNSRPANLSPTNQMFQLIWPGAMAAQVVYVAAKLGLADLIALEPKTARELSQATKTHSLSLGRFLRALVGLGIFTEDEKGGFHHTPLSETLRSEPVRAWAVMLGAPFIWRPWGELYEAVVTGRPAFERIFGSNLFDHLAAHPDDSSIFDAAMSSHSTMISTLLAAYDFSRFDRIVDVGGGRGELLLGILSAYPKLQGVLYDLPTVVAGVAAAGTGPVASRCEVVGGDFFKRVPEGADAYVLKQIIHSWNAEDASRILKNCRRAIKNDGTLLIMGDVLRQSSKPDPNGGLMDMMMLVLSPGQERTEEEYRALLEHAGFSLTRVIPTPGPSIIESRPA